MQTDTTWYRHFFTGAALDAQRRIYPPEATTAQVEFILEHLGVAAGAELLDVPCGNGRIALELTRRGFRVCGVDLAEDILEDAREASGAEGLEVHWENRDMRDLPWAGRFDAAFCFGNSFAYLEDGGDERFIHAVAGALKPGGQFALESGMVAEAVFADLHPREWYELDDMLLLKESTYDPAAGRLHTVFSFVRDGQLEARPASFRIYTCRQVVDMFESAGFGELRLLDADGQAYEAGGRVVYVLGVKQ